MMNNNKSKKAWSNVGFRHAEKGFPSVSKQRNIKNVNWVDTIAVTSFEYTSCIWDEKVTAWLKSLEKSICFAY